VIGLRSLWLGSLPLRTRFLDSDFWLWFGFGLVIGMRVWRLELGVPSWFCIREFLVVIRLISYGSWLWLVVSLRLLFSWYLGYGFVVLYFRCWLLASFGWVLVYDSFSLLLLSIRFELMNSLLAFIFYMGV